MRNYAKPCSTSIRATAWHLKFWHKYPNVRIRFFWVERQVSIARKRGFAPVKFLDETSSWLYGLHNWLNEYDIKSFQKLVQILQYKGTPIGTPMGYPIVGAPCFKVSQCLLFRFWLKEKWNVMILNFNIHFPVSKVPFHVFDQLKNEIQTG